MTESERERDTEKVRERESVVKRKRWEVGVHTCAHTHTHRDGCVSSSLP